VVKAGEVVMTTEELLDKLEELSGGDYSRGKFLYPPDGKIVLRFVGRPRRIREHSLWQVVQGAKRTTSKVLCDGLDAGCRVCLTAQAAFADAGKANDITRALNARSRYLWNAFDHTKGESEGTMSIAAIPYTPFQAIQVQQREYPESPFNHPDRGRDIAIIRSPGDGGRSVYTVMVKERVALTDEEREADLFDLDKEMVSGSFEDQKNFLDAWKKSRRPSSG